MVDSSAKAMSAQAVASLPVAGLQMLLREVERSASRAFRPSLGDLEVAQGTQGPHFGCTVLPLAGDPAPALERLLDDFDRVQGWQGGKRDSRRGAQPGRRGVRRLGVVEVARGGEAVAETAHCESDDRRIARLFAEVAQLACMLGCIVILLGLVCDGPLLDATNQLHPRQPAQLHVPLAHRIRPGLEDLEPAQPEQGARVAGAPLETIQ